MVPLDPTMKSMGNMFFQLYQLYLKLQNHLVSQKVSDNDFGNFYQQLYKRKVGLLYSQKRYKKVLNLTRGKDDMTLQSYCFRSLYHLGRTEKSLALMSEFLHKERMFLIYLRGYFVEFKNDKAIQEVLINTRSMD